MRQLEEEIFVFDSLYHTVSSCMKRQIAALLETKHNVITLKHMDVQMQSGTYDCGLFAIAFATARVHGEHMQRRGEVASTSRKKKHYEADIDMKKWLGRNVKML